MIEEATNIDRLREIALDQHGYVTAAQAVDLGVTRSALSMLRKRDRIERVAHGVYRVPQVPAGRNDAYMLAVLWTGEERAVVCRESALDIYGVCDVNPRAIDVSVPAGRRIRRSGGEEYRIHYEDVPQSMLTFRDGIPTVTLGEAVRGCIDQGTPSYLLQQALEVGVREGHIRADTARELSREIETRDGAQHA